MAYRFVKSEEDRKHDELELEMAHRPPARHKLPQRVVYPYSYALTGLKPAFVEEVNEAIVDPQEEADEAIENPQEEADQAIENPQEEADEAIENPQEEADEAIENPQQEADQAIENPQEEADQAIENPQEEADQAIENPQEEADEAIENPQEEADEAIENPQQEADQAIENPQQEADQAIENPQEEADQAIENPQEEADQALEDPQEEVDEDIDVPEEEADEDIEDPNIIPEGVEQPLERQEVVIEELLVSPEQMRADLLYPLVESHDFERYYKDNILPLSRRVVEDLELPRKVDDQYLMELKSIYCMAPICFEEFMFSTRFGRLVLMVRPWKSKLRNLNRSMRMCHFPCRYEYVERNRLMRLFLKDLLFAEARGDTEKMAKNNVAIIAWDLLQQEAVSVFVKQMAISYDQMVTADELVDNPVKVFRKWFRDSTPDNLGPDCEGNVKLISPNARVVVRAAHQVLPRFRLSEFRAVIIALIERYILSDKNNDTDLVFNAEFSMEEITMIRRIARTLKLATQVKEHNGNRSLIVKRKLDPFTIARHVIARGGSTPKYEVYIPLGNRLV